METVEDIQSAKSAFEHLKTANGDRKKAGWVEWDEAEKDGSDISFLFF